MTTLTSTELQEFKASFPDSESVEAAFQVIQDCNGNLEDAAEVLVIESGIEQEFIRAAEGGPGSWLVKLAERCCSVICREEFRSEIVEEYSKEAVSLLLTAVTAELERVIS